MRDLRKCADYTLDANGRCAWTSSNVNAALHARELRIVIRPKGISIRGGPPVSLDETRTQRKLAAVLLQHGFAEPTSRRPFDNLTGA